MRQDTTRYFLAAATAVLAGTTWAAGPKQQADPCANANTQSELTECSGKEYKKADAKLNATYAPLLAALDGEHQVILKAAQRAWIAFRDAECNLQASQALHGSLEPQLGYMCMESMTVTRIKDLEDLRTSLKDFLH